MISVIVADRSPFQTGLAVTRKEVFWAMLATRTILHTLTPLALPRFCHTRCPPHSGARAIRYNVPPTCHFGFRFYR